MMPSSLCPEEEEWAALDSSQLLCLRDRRSLWRDSSSTGFEEMSKKLQRLLFLWRSRRLVLTGRCAEFQYELGLFYYSRTLWKYPKSHCLKMLWDQDLSCQEQRSVPQPASSRHIFWEQTMDRRARYTECLSSNMNARPSLHFCTTVCK